MFFYKRQLEVTIDAVSINGVSETYPHKKSLSERTRITVI